MYGGASLTASSNAQEHVRASLTAEVRLALLCVGGALLSILLQGFLAGGGNNFFHLPIVMGLFDEKQFATDPYIQSLRNFSSLIWALFPRLTSDTAITASFQLLHILSRSLFFVGFVLCASTLGVTSWAQRIVLVLLLAVTPLMTGTGAAGNGGLFIGSFTHSEVGNGLTLIGLYLAMRERWIAALTVNAVMFNVNAFMAVWAFFPLAALFIISARDTYPDMASLLKRGATACVVFLIFSLPTVVWILSNPDFAKPLDFSYPDFLKYYTPTHFFFWSENIRPFHSITVREKIFLAIYLACASLAFFRLWPQSKKLSAVLASFVVLYCIGIAVPYLTGSKFILNLHLLRSSVFLHILATLSLLSLAAIWLTNSKAEYSHGLGPLLALTSCCLGTLVPLAIPVIVFEKPISRIASFFARENRGSLLVGARIAAVVLIVSGALYKSEKSRTQLAETAAILDAWKQLGSWVKTNTNEASVFLLPVMPFGSSSEQRPVGGHRAYEDWGSFEAAADRQVWVDFRRGAAVMWQSSYFDVWSQRIKDVLALKSLAVKIDYSRLHKIDYVVSECTEPDAADFSAVFHNAYVCLYDASNASSAAK